MQERNQWAGAYTAFATYFLLAFIAIKTKAGAIVCTEFGMLLAGGSERSPAATLHF